jgi:hypothetical protein
MLFFSTPLRGNQKIYPYSPPTRKQQDLFDTAQILKQCRRKMLQGRVRLQHIIFRSSYQVFQQVLDYFRNLPK